MSSCSTSRDGKELAVNGFDLAGSANDKARSVPISPVAPSNEVCSPKSREYVSFDGTNYIKKSGWRVPSRIGAYPSDANDADDPKRMTESGKQVEMVTNFYVYKSPWNYSQIFCYEGSALDFMKGKISAGHFFEMSFDAHVFMYTVGGNQKVSESTAMSNVGSHEDPFVYQIMDKDGDGIFETLLGGEYEDIVVPEWVLK